MADTEAHRSTEDHLRESEARFRAFVLAGSDVVYRMSPDWSVLQQLDGMNFLTDAHEPNRSWLTTYIPSDERPRLTAAINDAIRAKSIFELEHRVVRADGTPGWALSRAAPILGGTGEIVEWIGSAKDVTDRKRVEEDLRRSEDLLRIAIAGGRMGIWCWDLREGLIWGDAAFLTIWGFEPSSEPQPLSIFTDRMSPQGQTEMGVVVARAVEAGEEFDGQLEVIGGTAAGHWVRWRGRADSQQPWVLHGVSFDITEQRQAVIALKESEERSRALVTAGAVSIYRMSPDWRVMYQLDSETLAITSEPIEGWSVKYILEEDQPVVQSAIEQAIRNKAMFELEHRVQLADGSVGWVLSRAVPLFNPDGDIVEWFGAGTDVTARKRVEAALRESEARLKLAFRTLPVGIAIVDAAGKTVTANDEMRRYMPTGRIPSRDPERSANWRGWDADGRVVRPEDFPAARALRGEAISSGMQMLYLDDSGAEIWTEVLSAALQDADGRGNGAITVVIDVDRLKRSEEAAQASEERFAQFAASSSDLLWIRHAATLEMEYVSPAIEAIYGVPPEHILDGTENWTALIVPEDRGTALAHLEQAKAGRAVVHEFRIERPSDGTVRWIRNTDFPLRDAGGRVQRIGGIAKDVTDLKATEAALADAEHRQRLLLEGMPQLVWRSADDGLWTWSSPQWQAYTGQTMGESLGWGWLDVVHPDERDATMRAWHEARPHGMLDVEYRVFRASDGAWRWHATRSVPLRASPVPGETEGRILEWLGTTTDIEDLKALQAQQAVMVAELQHRTRNLIGVVRGISEDTMEHTDSREAFRDAFADRLSALSRVQGLLSRSEAEPISIGALVRLELDAIGARAFNGRVTAAGPEVFLRPSSVQTLALALHELATNARKYGALSHDRGHLAVTWREEVEDGVPRLTIDWLETGLEQNLDRPGLVDSGGGYGRELIEQALPHATGARTSYMLTASGVRCTIDIAVRPGMGGTNHDGS